MATSTAAPVTETQQPQLSTNRPADIISSPPLWMELLKQTRVSDVIDANRKLVKAEYYEPVDKLLAKMAEAKVLAAVITDSVHHVWGFVDVLDLLMFVLEVTAQSGKELTLDNIRNLKWEGQCFSRQMSGLISNLSKSDPFYTVTFDTNLLDVVKIFAEEVHRVAVIDKDTKRVVNVISQSDIISLLATSGPYLGSAITRPLVEVGLAPVGVATVTDSAPVLQVLRYMKDTTVSGVAVVDMNKRIIANFSGADLLGLNESNFSLLSLPVKEYLNRVHGEPKPPVTVFKTDTVEMVLLKMYVHKVHRVYVIEPSARPIGVITNTDIMGWLLKPLNSAH